MVNDQCLLVPIGAKRGAFSKLSPELQKMVLEYIESKCTFLASSTVLTDANVGTIFLLFMQDNQLSAETITEDDVLRFFTKDGKSFRCSGQRAILSKFFDFCSNQYPSYEKIINWIPKIRKERKNIQYLTDDEVQKVKSVCLDENSNLSYCDKAIALTLLYTGLRAGDIASLKLSDIDWDKEVIHLVQNKTGVPLTIPMVIHVSNAIYDYKENERDYDGDQLFVTSEGIPFKSNGVARSINRTFKKAGIRQNKGDRRGSHIFRHHLATKLLENEVPQPVISQTLGHMDPTSVETYLSADIKHLRQCALSIEPYSLDWEVFDNA